MLQHPYACRTERPTTALVGIRCIREAIADHPSTRRQCRSYDLGQVLGSRGKKQQSLGIPSHTPKAVIQQQSSNGFPQRSPAGLSGNNSLDGLFAQKLGDIPEAGGLARAFQALDCDEPRQPGASC
jgi:hypothetical protein